MKINEALALRQELSDALKSLGSEKRRHLLAEILQRKPDKGNQTSELQRAFAAVFWVRDSFESDLKDGLILLRLASKIFEEVSLGKQSFASLRKDLGTFTGNLYVRYGEFALAIEPYLQAMRHEANPERKTSGYINVARAQMNLGRVFDALKTIEACRVRHLSDKNLIAYIHLFRARILMVLGADRMGFDNLERIVDQDLLQPNIQVECIYLRMQATTDFSQGEEVVRGYGKLVEAMRRMGKEFAWQFYELEGMLFQHLLSEKMIKNRRNFLARAKFLSEKCNIKSYYSFLLKLDAWLQSSDTGSFRKLHEALGALVVESHHLLYQRLLINLTRQLVKKQMYEKAVTLLNDLEGHLERKSIGLSRKALNEMSLDEGFVRRNALLLKQALPQVFQDDLDHAGVWLLG